MVNETNERAIKSYTKAGFVVEGILRHDRRHHGKFVNSIMMLLLREEWSALSRAKSWQLGEPQGARP